MICTRCGLWEVAGKDNFCSWCGAAWLAAEVRLEPAEVRWEDYPPPVRLVVVNTSRERTIEVAGITTGVGWISLMSSDAVPCQLEAGEQKMLLLDVNTFGAGSEASSGEGDATVTIEVRLGFGGSAQAALRVRHGVAGAGGMPFADWQVVGGQEEVETAHSTSFQVLDGASGRTFRVRTYRGDGTPSQAVLRRFIDTARSLRESTLAPVRVWFAYTLDGRCSTVGEDYAGRRLDEVATPGRMNRTEIRRWLRAVLQALAEMHAQVGAAGPVYHGDLELQHMLVAEEGSAGEAAGQVMLTSGMYLEHVVTESPYSPEYFIESDLVHAGVAMLSLISGTDARAATPHEQAGLLDAVDDVAVGATLDFLVRPAANRLGSAQKALAFFDALVRAEMENHRAEFEKAYALSGSARLLPVIATLGELEASVEGRRRHAAEYEARQRHLAAQAESARRAAAGRSVASPPPPPPPPPRPMVQPMPTYITWSTRARLLFAMVVKWLKIASATALVLVAVGTVVLLYRLGSWLRESKPAVTAEAPSLSLTATPNPVKRGQRTTLNWNSKGYTRVLLDGNSVGTTGFRLVYPNATVTYHFEAFMANGTHKSEDLRVAVVGSRPKPKAGVQSVAPAQEPSAAKPE